MAKYMFTYHGGDHPDTDEEVAKVLDDWGKWLGSMGAAVVDGGNRLVGVVTVDDQQLHAIEPREVDLLRRELAGFAPARQLCGGERVPTPARR